MHTITFLHLFVFCRYLGSLVRSCEMLDLPQADAEAQRPKGGKMVTTR